MKRLTDKQCLAMADNASAAATSISGIAYQRVASKRRVDRHLVYTMVRSIANDVRNVDAGRAAKQRRRRA